MSVGEAFQEILPLISLPLWLQALDVPYISQILEYTSQTLQLISRRSHLILSRTIIIIIQLLSSHFYLCYVSYINKLNCTPLIIMVFEHQKMKIQYALQKHKWNLLLFTNVHLSSAHWPYKDREKSKMAILLSLHESKYNTKGRR